MKSNERGNTIAVSREAMPRNANYLSPLPFHASIISNGTKLQIIINIKCDKCPNHPTYVDKNRHSENPLGKVGVPAVR